CFPFIAFDDTKARLDNFAIELQNNPSAQGYMIVYSGTGSRAGQAERLIERAKDYLMKERTLDVSRLTVINGCYRDTDYFEPSFVWAIKFAKVGNVLWVMMMVVGARTWSPCW